MSIEQCKGFCKVVYQNRQTKTISKTIVGNKLGYEMAELYYLEIKPE